MPQLKTRSKLPFLLVALAAQSLGTAGCGDDGGAGPGGADGGPGAGALRFEGDRNLLPGFEQDTGFLPADSPAQVRVVARAEASLGARADARSEGPDLTPEPGTGQLSASGELTLELFARVDTTGIEYEGPIETFGYAIPAAETTFDPFLLDGGEASVTNDLPRHEVARVPVPSVPGSTVVLTVEGGSITTAFRGVCAEAAEGAGHYTGETTSSGTVDLSASIEVEIPFSGTETFGPFEFTLDIPELTSGLDLGVRSLDTGEAVEGRSICGTVTVPDGGAPSDGGAASDGGAPSDGGTIVPDDCLPLTCEDVGAECGVIDDSCGGTVGCGFCNDSLDECGRLVPNQCAPPCEALECEPSDCGPTPDGCGRTLDCGPCPDACDVVDTAADTRDEARSLGSLTDEPESSVDLFEGLGDNDVDWFSVRVNDSGFLGNPIIDVTYDTLEGNGAPIAFDFVCDSGGDATTCTADPVEDALCGSTGLLYGETTLEVECSGADDSGTLFVRIGPDLCHTYYLDIDVR